MRILTILFGPKLGYVESYDKKCVAIPEPLEFAAEGAVSKARPQTKAERLAKADAITRFREGVLDV